MASSSSSKPPQQSEEPPQQSEEPPQPLYKTKLISTYCGVVPIVLQDKNGPCPLLAICNVLSLRKQLNLLPIAAKVSQKTLLSRVARILWQSISESDNEDAAYVEYQQQNIAENAIPLLPQLATGIDVNIKFTRISDFESTPECAIFEKLDIPLYHGWIVDPKDKNTANAIGSKSYNTLMGELVTLATQNVESERKGKNIPQEDRVDIVAATTGTLGVPSLSLSKTRSFDESPHSASDEPKVRKGDREEEADLLRALQMSATELPTSVGDPLAASIGAPPLLGSSDGRTHLEKVMPVGSVYKSEKPDTHQSELSVPDNTASRNEWSDLISCEISPGQTSCSARVETTEVKYNDQPTSVKLEDVPKDLVAKRAGNESDLIKGAVSTSPYSNHESIDENRTGVSKGSEKIEDQVNLVTNADGSVEINKQNVSNMIEVPCIPASNVVSDSSSGRMLGIDESEALASRGEGSEPIYEGEERILDSGTPAFEKGEPIYKGEAVLAKQADKGMTDGKPKDEITPQQGELISTFLENSSQLTSYGLSRLKDGLKELQLCVLFRNNHFSTMLKFNGELYLLVTDQGYLDQPDLVWEKLNEVNGNTLFMTGNFKEFNVEKQSSTADGKLLVPRTGGEIYGKSEAGADRVVPVRVKIIRRTTVDVKEIGKVNPWDSGDAHKFHERITNMKQLFVKIPAHYMIVYLHDENTLSDLEDGAKLSKLFCPHLAESYEYFCSLLDYVEIVRLPFERYYEIEDGDELLLIFRVRGEDIEDNEILEECYAEIIPSLYPDLVTFINDVNGAINLGWVHMCPEDPLPPGCKTVFCTYLPYGKGLWMELPQEMAWPRFVSLLAAVFVFDNPEACKVRMYSDEEASRKQH